MSEIALIMSVERHRMEALRTCWTASDTHRSRTDEQDRSRGDFERCCRTISIIKRPEDFSPGAGAHSHRWYSYTRIMGLEVTQRV